LSKAYLQITGIRRETSEWLSNKRTIESIQHLSSKVGISPIELVQKIKGGNFIQGRGTWIHPELFENFDLWLRASPTKTLNELTIQEQLHNEIGGIMEVSIPPGKVDILTDSELIEVKPVKNWMKGVGQVMIYGQHFPNHQKRIHLFGRVRTKKMIESHCKQLKIKVTWHDSEKNVIDTA